MKSLFETSRAARPMLWRLEDRELEGGTAQQHRDRKGTGAGTGTGTGQGQGQG